MWVNMYWLWCNVMVHMFPFTNLGQLGSAVDDVAQSIRRVPWEQWKDKEEWNWVTYMGTCAFIAVLRFSLIYQPILVGHYQKLSAASVQRMTQVS